MQNSPYSPDEAADQPGRPGPLGPPDQPVPPETARIPGTLVFGLVVAVVHALGTAVGGWAILEENYSKQEHGQDLILPMGAAWFMALLCWGMAALQIACVVLARKRRPWIRVVLAVLTIFVAASMALGFLLSLATGAPSIVSLVIFVVDVAVLRVVLGETGRRWFSVRGTAPAPPRM